MRKRPFFCGVKRSRNSFRRKEQKKRISSATGRESLTMLSGILFHFLLFRLCPTDVRADTHVT